MLVHENVLMEMHSTQHVIKECDTNSYDLPGYIQHFQINPFGAHLYTEEGISILVHYLRGKKSVLCHYILMEQEVWYQRSLSKAKECCTMHSLCLEKAEMLHLFQCEILRNEHRIPPLAFWLMQFQLKLSKYTRVRVQKVETDYIWALMQVVVLAFNRHNINAYLE